VGIKTTGVSNRKFRPNLQRVRAVVGGSAKTIRVCAKCIRNGKVQKPSR
jgi:large subunit ribosomal protein L28